MANEEAQQILEQLNNATVSQRQWNVASADGMSQAMSQAAASHLQRMQDRQMDQLQAQLSQQNYLRAYSNAMPGVPSPTQIYSDPTMSNYALQNMYTMNPYMANFFGQSQGAPSMMGMAPPSFQTSPRMGLFRGTRYDQQGRPVAERGLISDVAALMRRDQSMNYFNPVNWTSLGMQRTFAPHEDPIDEVIEAKRRMYRRGESLAGAGIMAGDIALGLAVGGPAGLALGMATLPISIGASAYFQRRAETSQIQDISRGIATGANAGGYRNLGFSGAESARMMQGMRRDAAASPFYSMSDMTQMFEQATQNNLFAFTGNSQQTTASFKKIVASIDTFMRLAGDPDVQSAMQRMSTLQNYGATIPQMTGVATNMRGLANLAGTSVSQMMQTTGAYGAQVAAQMGQSPLFGMIAGGTAQAAARSMVQRGALSPTELAIRGGEEGVTQSLTQILTNTIGTAVEQRFAGIQAGNPNATLQDSFRAMGKMSTRELMDYQRELKDKSAQHLANMTPADQVGYLRGYVKELQGYYGKSLSRDDILRSRFGESWMTVRDMMGSGFARDQLAQQSQASATEIASEKEKFLQRHSTWNRFWTGVNEGINTLGASLADYERKASEEQKEALGATGMVLPAGFSGFSGNLEQAELYKRFTGDVSGARKADRGLVYNQAIADKGVVGEYLKMEGSRGGYEKRFQRLLSAADAYTEIGTDGKFKEAYERMPAAERADLVNRVVNPDTQTIDPGEFSQLSPAHQSIVRRQIAEYTELSKTKTLTPEAEAAVLAGEKLGKVRGEAEAAEEGVLLTGALDSKERARKMLGISRGSRKEEILNQAADLAAPLIDKLKGSKEYQGLSDRDKKSRVARAQALLSRATLGTLTREERSEAEKMGISSSELEKFNFASGEESLQDLSKDIQSEFKGSPADADKWLSSYMGSEHLSKGLQAEIQEKLPIRQAEEQLNSSYTSPERKEAFSKMIEQMKSAKEEERAEGAEAYSKLNKTISKESAQESKEVLEISGGSRKMEHVLAAQQVQVLKELSNFLKTGTLSIREV